MAKMLALARFTPRHPMKHPQLSVTSTSEARPEDLVEPLSGGCDQLHILVNFGVAATGRLGMD
jgi:hypothetical protein